MQIRKIDHRHVWLLSGTGEGPLLANALVERGFLVSVSVVSYQASLPYRDFPLEAIWIGPIGGVEGVRQILKKAEFDHYGFDFVLDATHPFASLISSDLNRACKEINQALLRFERIIESPSWVSCIASVEDIPRESLSGKNFLFAIGSRNLLKAASSAIGGGSNVFARILDSPQSLRSAFSSSIPPDHFAVVRPFSSDPLGEVEKALCRKWSINSVVCRQSGGITQRLWQQISSELNLKLYLISRPVQTQMVETVYSLKALLDRISTFK